MSNNTVILIGNLGQQPELRETASGMAVCNFSVATNERQRKGEEWTTHTEWHNITVFGTQASNCAKYLAKGSKESNEYTGPDPMQRADESIPF